MVRALVIGSAAAGVSWAAGWYVVPLLRRLGLGKAISEEGPESHAVKAGTPTMGGILFLGVLAVVTVTTNVAGHPSVLLPLGVMACAAAVGLADDLQTLQGRARGGGHEPIGFLVKSGIMAVVGLVAGLIVYLGLDVDEMRVPHFDSYGLAAGSVVVAVVVMVATTSATAVTDGLDGLLAGLSVLAFGAYGVIAYAEGESHLAVFCFTLAGALLGFLWHNAHPATVIMGDLGSLPLGAGLATVALMTGWWLVLPVVGVVLVAEGLSVALQIGSFRLTRQRILRMAPVHHHFELAGWSEPQVVLRFWLVGAVGALLGFAIVLTG
jgi:phospho-N-acetylmuramoyl-pentapeptide-transferase